MHARMIRIALAISLLTLALCATASGARPTATAAKSCKLTTSQQFHSGATYLLKLSVSGVSCATGLKVEKAFQSCRRATAGHTTCKKRVLGYRCTQKVLDSIKSQYDASVSCKSGSRAVGFTYTQNK